MEYSAPFQNRTKMTFALTPWHGKEYLQVSFNITAQLNVKLFSTHSSALGRSRFALAGLPQRHCKVLTSSFPAEVKCSYWYVFRAAPSAEEHHYSTPVFPSLLNTLLWAALLMKIVSLVLLPKWMQTLCQHPAALPVSNSFQAYIQSVFWWCSVHNRFYINLMSLLVLVLLILFPVLVLLKLFPILVLLMLFSVLLLLILFHYVS